MVIETNITKMFGIKHPILNAPMGPYLTNQISVALCEAGGMGVVSHTAGLESLAALRDAINNGVDIVKAMQENQENQDRDYMLTNLKWVAEHTDKPFGFNLRTSRNEMDATSIARRLPKQIMEDPKLREQVVYAVTSAGSPKLLPASKPFQRLREQTGIKHFHVAPALWLADKCVAAGVDGLVCTGTEGGGHQSYEKVSTLVLLQQVRQKYPDLPIMGCGGIASGEGLAAVLAMGGGGIEMGTRFIASKDSEYHEAYKGMVPPMKAGDTRLVTGMLGPIRLWKNRFCMAKDLVGSKAELVAKEEARSVEAMMKEMLHYLGALEGEMEDSAILIGQSGGVINSIESIDDIVTTLMSDAERLIKNAYNSIK